MKLKLDDGLVLNLPQADELFGIDNLLVVAAFAGRTAGKTKRYAEDGRLSFMEKIGIFRMIGKTVDEGKTIDFKALKAELSDLSHNEREELRERAEKEYMEALKAEENIDGESIIEDFVAVGISVVNWVGNRIQNKAA